MKKISLLLTILCVSAINGMETSEPSHYAGIMWENIPADIKPLIIMSLTTYKNLDDIINTIKAASVTNKALNKMINDKWGNPQGFRNLVQILAKKFPTLNSKTIAEKFGTPVANNYIALSEALHQAFSSNLSNTDNFIAVAQPLIQEGADVNYQSLDEFVLLHRAILKNNIEVIKFLLENNANPNSIAGKKTRSLTPTEASPFIKAIAYPPINPEIIKLLLQYGANAKLKSSSGQTLLDIWKKWHESSPDLETEQLLEEAMRK